MRMQILFMRKEGERTLILPAEIYYFEEINLVCSLEKRIFLHGEFTPELLKETDEKNKK